LKNRTLLLFTLILLASCSVTKRKYLPGYAIDWKHKAPVTVVQNKPRNGNFKRTEISINKIVHQIVFRADTDSLGTRSLFKSVHHNKSSEIKGGTPGSPSNPGAYNNPPAQQLPSNYNNPRKGTADNPTGDGDPNLNWAAIVGFIFIFLFFPLGLILCAIGLRSQLRSLAKTGIVIFITLLVLAVFFLLIYVVAMASSLA
jgi:hypothetical protein